MTDDAIKLPADLRARLETDYRPVRVMRSPFARALWLLPLAALALVAAPIAFNVRPDAPQLGWLGVWGFSILQSAIGLVVVAAALRESIPGRGWSRGAIALWLSMPVIAIVAVTMISFQQSPVSLDGGWWVVGGACFSGSAATALPVVAFASILAARAYPTRPALAGALLGLGAGLMADAGWRIFCHFSEPGHVLSAHLAAVVMSTTIGSLVAVRFTALNQEYPPHEPIHARQNDAD
jgi:hypothetical protein